MAYDFDGSTGYVSRATTPITGIPLTLAAWFNSDITSGRVIIGIGSSAASAGFTMGLSSGGSALYAKTEAAGTANQAITSVGYSAGTWYHGCAVFTSATLRDAYIDGGSSGTNTTSRTPASLDTTAVGIYIRNAVATSFMDGRIAYAGIWNVALDTSEIAALAKGYHPKTIRRSALKFCWDGVSSELVDQFGAPLTKTGTVNRADSPRIIRGSQGSARWLSVAAGGGGSVFTPYYFHQHIARAA